MKLIARLVRPVEGGGYGLRLDDVMRMTLFQIQLHTLPLDELGGGTRKIEPGSAEYMEMKARQAERANDPEVVQARAEKRASLRAMWDGEQSIDD